MDHLIPSEQVGDTGHFGGTSDFIYSTPSPVILFPLYRRTVREGKGYLSTAGDTVAHRKTGSGDCGQTTIPGVLFQAVYYPEGDRQVETDNRPESPQPIHFTTKIQDGDGAINSSLHSTGRVCRQSRSDRRIFSRPYPPCITEISQICLPRHGLPVQGPTLWPQYQLLGFYQGYGLRRHLVPLDVIYWDGSVPGRHPPETYGERVSGNSMSRYPLGQLLLLFLTIVQGQRSDKWDFCGCRFLEWESWSSCTETCGGGYAIRSRKVQYSKKPECTKFTDCAANEDGSDYQGCNTNCFNGGSFMGQRSILVYSLFHGKKSGYCKCVDGYYGTCCDTIVTCGYPGNIWNGQVKGTDYTYNKVVSYVCNDKYNLTGSSSRQCTRMRTWTGAAPTCIFAKHCEKEPCRNGARCIDNLGFYTCICTNGWTGKNCDVDIQPPVVKGCSGNIFEFVSSLTREITWQAPTFADPMGTSLIIQSNYDNNSYEFPWGDFTVQYIATKPSNGLVSNCVFNISIRPNPCKDLDAPFNGILVCNGWKKDYDHVCLFSCLSGFSLSPEFNSFELYTCGASGNWLPIFGPNECVENESGLTFGNPVDIGIKDCRDVSQIKLASNYFIEKLNSSSFSAVCKDYPTDCLPDNVDVSCR